MLLLSRFTFSDFFLARLFHLIIIFSVLHNGFLILFSDCIIQDFECVTRSYVVDCRGLQFFSFFWSELASLMMVLCEFCNTKPAFLFCRADWAKLCLLCDLQVHSANALSLMHLRLQICDSCRAEPVSVCCFNENLMLCQNCDWDSHRNHSGSSLHERCSVEGFTGCPSVPEMADLFGFELKAVSLENLSSGFGVYGQNRLKLDDILVRKQIYSVFTRCEKYNQEVGEQIVEMYKRELEKLNCNHGADLGPGTPPNRGDQLGNMESLQMENMEEEELLHQQTTFTALLNLTPNVDLRDYYGIVAENDLLWDCHLAYEAPQVGIY